MHAVWFKTAWCHSSFTAGGLGGIWFLSFWNHVLEKSDRCGSEHYGLYLWGRDPERGHTGGCGGPRWDAVLGLSLSQSLLRNHHQLTHLCPDQHHTSNTQHTRVIHLWPHKIHKASQNRSQNQQLKPLDSSESKTKSDLKKILYGLFSCMCLSDVFMWMHYHEKYIYILIVLKINGEK